MYVTFDSVEDVRKHISRQRESQKEFKKFEFSLKVKVANTDYSIPVTEDILIDIARGEGVDRLRADFLVNGLRFWWMPEEKP